jgi:16S rRNA (uracil1498-N3)-methyltransferase
MSLAMFVLPTIASARVGDVVELDGDEGHHAAAVRRLAAGEHLQLTDGAGAVAVCRVAEVGKGRLSAEVLEVAVHPPEMPRLVVVQALPKGDRGELAVEVLTEVGVATVVPWAASRSVAVWKGERAEKSLNRWRSTAREAAKQARRPWFPEVADLASTDDVVALVRAADLTVVLHEQATSSLAGLDVPASGRIIVVVGPEGGLSEDEVAAFVAAGAVSVRLGAEVLRTSTAGVAAVAALLARTPRWS